MSLQESVSGNRATEIDRHSCRPATNLSPKRKTKFAQWADVCFGDKPSAAIASIVNCDLRTAQRMLAGQAEVPWCLLRVMVDEMLKPE